MKEKELRLLTVVYPGPMARSIKDRIQQGTAARRGGHPEGNKGIKIKARCFRTGLLKLSKTAGSRCLRTGGLLLRFRSALEQLGCLDMKGGMGCPERGEHRIFRRCLAADRKD